MKLIEEMRSFAAAAALASPDDMHAVVTAWADTLANSGALIPVSVEPKPIGHDGWFMTPTGLGWWGSDADGIPCVETPTGYHDYPDCYPVRLVPIAEWEAEV